MVAIARDMRSTSQPRRGLRRVEAAVYVGVSPTKFDEMVQDGRMPHPKKIDSANVWDIRDIDSAFDELPGNGMGREVGAANPWD